MESIKLEYDAIIKCVLKERCNATTIHQHLAAVYVDCVPHYCTITRWYNEFKRASSSPQIAWSAWTLLSSNNCKSRVLSTTWWSCWLLIVDGLMPVHTTVLMARVHGWCFWHPRTQAVNTGSVDRRPCSWRWCTSALNTVRVYGCQKRRPWNARDGTNGMFTLNRSLMACSHWIVLSVLTRS